MSLFTATLTSILDRQPPAPRYWIAYSGGIDSQVLLHACSELKARRPDLDFAAVHVHHGLQAAAEQWAEFCEASCRELGIQYRLLRVNAAAKPGQSPEEAARSARYQALRALLSEGEVVLTAQHRDDQAETLLLQLFRGAGIAGLAAMPERADFGPGFLMRPFLTFSRAQLCEYAESHGLAWIEDPSNLDLRFDRNFIRHEVIPLLEKRWPSTKDALARTARHCAEAQALLDSLAENLLKSVLHPERNTLDLDRLRTYSQPDGRLILREWLRSRGFRMPSTRVIDRALDEALSARPDRNPTIRWSEGEIRRYRGELFLMPVAPPFHPHEIIPWDGISTLRLPDQNGDLSVTHEKRAGISREAWRSGTITVRYRQGGERMRLPSRDGSHELKKLFQEAGIPPWIRERTPLVYIDNELASVAGLWLSDSYAGKPDDTNVVIRWRAPDGFSGATFLS
ncbi:tRNA lysidine(34) synthetase TilS [Methylocaldum marinum]|nr:tRNA lysidine(34) synthetase TilS [Methylocaldum marinum]